MDAYTYEEMQQIEAHINKRNKFRDELAGLINRYSLENGSNTPDFILANYLMSCLDVWNDTIRVRNDFVKPI